MNVSNYINNFKKTDRRIIKHSLLLLFVTFLVSCGEKQSEKMVFKPTPLNGKDTAISASNKKSNFSTLDRVHMLSLSINDSIDNDTRSLLRFGFATLPEKVTVDSAFIYLYSIDPGHFGKDNSFVLEPLKNIWINKEINWENQPESDASKAVKLEAPKTKDQDYKIDVTNYVSNVSKNLQANYGFMLKLENEKKSYKGVRFHSSDSEIEDKRPRLEVYFSE